MNTSVTIWHNPRCSKSRTTLQLLTDRGVETQVVEYLKTPPTEAEIKKVLQWLDMTPRDLMRQKESLYEELGLQNQDLDSDALVHAMAAHPILIERPIVIRDQKAVIGRPPELIESLF